jgi:hypothetical protein
MVSESLDEEIYKEHYSQQQAATQKFQRNLKVPPIDFSAGSTKYKNQSSSLKQKKSPKHQKHFSEDAEISGPLARQSGYDKEQNIAEQIRSKLYPGAANDLEEAHAKGTEVFGGDEEATLEEDKVKARRERMARLPEAPEEGHGPGAAKATKIEARATEKLEEIDEDVDES